MFGIVKGNLSPSMTVNLTDGGAAFVLQGGDAVTLIWRKPDGTYSSGSMVVVSMLSGQVRRDWLTGDTNIVGVYEGMVDVVRAGQTHSFPNDGSKLYWSVYPKPTADGA